MLSTVENKTTTLPDGWSRDPDGSIRMEALTAFRLFGSIMAGDVPSYAANFLAEDGMEFEDFIDKNGIVIPIASLERH